MDGINLILTSALSSSPEGVFHNASLNFIRPTTIKTDQVYSNTRVSSRVNTNQHELTQVNTNQHESDTNQHESDTIQHESTQVNTS